jgi:hypothetical protein
MKNQDFFYLACGIYQVLLEVDGKLGSLSLIFKVILKSESISLLLEQ